MDLTDDTAMALSVVEVLDEHTMIEQGSLARAFYSFVLLPLDGMTSEGVAVELVNAMVQSRRWATYAEARQHVDATDTPNAAAK